MTADSRKTIFIFTTVYDPFIGGAEIAIQEVTRELASVADFFVFTARLRKSLPAVEKKGNTTIIRIGWGGRFDKFLLPLVGPFVISRWRRRYPPSIFWCVMISFGAGAAYLWNFFHRKKIPLVLTLQEGDPESHIRRSRLGLIGLSWRAAFQLEPPAAVTAISSYLGELACRFGWRGNTAIIPNGAALDLFRGAAGNARSLRKEIGIPEDAAVVITTSRLVEKNGVDILITAISSIPNMHLVIVGEGEERRDLEKLAKETGRSDRVHFLGARPYRELPQYLKMADIFARPSRSEGMGNSFIEAMAAGIPVIGTPVGGIVDFLVDGVNGLVVPPEDPKALAAAIRRLVNDPDLRKKLSAAASATAERYDWPGIAKGYWEVFQEVGSPRILIASGIYPPEVGGTADVALRLEKDLGKSGFRVRVLSYGEGAMKNGERISRKTPSGLRHLKAFFAAWRELRGAEAAIFLDHFSMGSPAALAAWFLRQPYIVRVGGDFLWERHVESRREEISLPDFYQKGLRLSWKERIISHAARFVFRRAKTVVFTTAWLRSIFIPAYGIEEARTAIVENPCRGRKGAAYSGTDNGEIIYAGRFIFLKNLLRTLEAFKQYRASNPQTNLRLRFIGAGGGEYLRLKDFIHQERLEAVVSLEEVRENAPLLNRVEQALSSARAAIVSSFSDVSPNFALEALSRGVPLILTANSGYRLGEEDGVIRIDPFDERDMEKAFRRLDDPASFEHLKAKARDFHCRSTEESEGEGYRALLTQIL